MNKTLVFSPISVKEQKTDVFVFFINVARFKDIQYLYESDSFLYQDEVFDYCQVSINPYYVGNADTFSGTYMLLKKV